MQIKRDSITGLWAREDGAVLMPPCRNIHRFVYTWTFGSNNGKGYLTVWYRGRQYRVHRIICRAFHGLPPAGKPEVDHFPDRDRSNNRADNLRWADRSLNNINRAYADVALAKYGVRACDDRKAYSKVYAAAHREERRAYRKVYNEAHREEQKAYMKAYYERRKSEVS